MLLQECSFGNYHNLIKFIVVRKKMKFVVIVRVVKKEFTVTVIVVVKIANFENFFCRF